MKEIQLTQGKIALVDDDIFDYINQWKWCAAKDNYTWYAMRTIGLRPFKTTVAMHRIITKAQDEYEVDHRDGDGLNNQMYNLRVCTSSQNQMNKRVQKNNTSGFKGVFESGKRWQAAIKVANKRTYLGSFVTPEEAARAYDKAAKELHGEFAYLNFPNEPHE